MAGTEQAFLAFLVEGVSDSVIVYAIDPPERGRIIYVNEAAARTRGYSREEMLRLDVRDLIAPDATWIFDVGTKALAEDGDFTSESTHMRKDGTTFPVEIMVRLVDYEGRRVAVNVSRDITERKRFEEEMQQTLAREKAAREEAAREATLSKALLRASAAIADSVDASAISAEIAASIHEATGRKRVWVQLWNESRRTMRHVASFGERAPHVGFEFDFDKVTQPTRDAVFGRRIAVIDYDTMPGEERSEYADEFGFRCILIVPIVVADTLIGLIAVDDPEEHNCFDAGEIDLIEGVAAQSAIVIRNADLFEAQQAELARTKLLQRVGMAAAAAQDLPDLGDNVLAAIDEFSAIRTGDLRLIEGDTLRFVAWRGYPERMLDEVKVVPLSASQYLAVRAVRERRLVTHEDEILDDERKGLLLAAGVTDARYFVLPIRHGDRVLGTFALSLEGKQAFSDEDLAMYQAIADVLGQAMENARLFEAEVAAEHQAESELATTVLLLEAAEVLRNWDNLHQLAAGLAEILLRATSHRRSIIDTFDARTGEIEVVGSAGEQPFEVGSRWPLEKVSAVTRRVVAERRTTIADFDQLPQADRGIAADPYRLRQLLYVPLMRHDRFVGMIVLDDPDEHRDFTEREIDIVEAIAAQAAVSIENARLYERQNKAAELNEALARIDNSIHSTLEPEEMLRRVVVEAAEAIGCESSALDAREAGKWVVRHVHRFPADSMGNAFTDEQVPFAAMAARDRAPVVINDAFTDSRVDPDLQRAYNVRSVMVAPLVVRDEVVAVIFFNYHESFHTFTAEEIAFIQRLSASLGLALDNARLYENQRTRRHRVEALHGVLELAVTSFDLHESAEHILGFLQKQHGFAFSTIWLGSADSLELLACRGYPEAYRDQYSPMAFDAPFEVARVFRRGEAIIVPDAGAADSAVRVTSEAMGVDLGSYLMLPMRSRGKIIGILQLGWDEPHEVNDFDFDFYDSIAREVGLVLDNVRLYETERDIADRLQEALLALPDELHGIEFAHIYHSATETARVGGDFYDLMELDEDHLGILIGDVAGKGLNAAVLTSMVKNTVRAHASEQGKTPAQVLALTNEVVYRATGTEAFVTVFFGVLDCRDGRLVYANAGHTQAALLRRDGEVSGLSATGPLLGAFANVTFGQEASRLDLDELLFLYTDGLTEARRQGDFYGEERLFDFLGGRSGSMPAADVVRDVVDSVVRFSENRLKDDLAILAVKRTKRSESLPQQQSLEV